MPRSSTAEPKAERMGDVSLRQAEQDRRMAALDAYLEAYEVEHGEITDEQMRTASRRARGRALVVRTPATETDRASAREAPGAT